MLYVMGKNQENVITTCDSGYRYPDIYDIDDEDISITLTITDGGVVE